jgi:kinesin family protein 4/21/27
VSAESQVVVGKEKTFTYDHAFGTDSTQEQVYETVKPLLSECFKGYNATVLAYGQTGSGKTFTMGNDFGAALDNCGMIPRAIREIFTTIDDQKTENRYVVKVTYLEIYNEEIRDLLTTATSKQQEVAVRDDPVKGVIVAGLREEVVVNYEDICGLLTEGMQKRVTASTLMNEGSSRSHSICTLTIENHGAPTSDVTHSPLNEDSCVKWSKLQLVDLAGSERQKRTQAKGNRLKEGININLGLLALGNVISALGDPKKRAAGMHVPYRDSKLTRLLQDSLGGNSRTLMVACVSPADVNMDESVNTLRYAHRARNIQNKAVVNVDPAQAELSRLRKQVQLLQLEMLQSGPLARLGAAGGADSETLKKALDENKQLRRAVVALEGLAKAKAKEASVSAALCVQLQGGTPEGAVAAVSAAAAATDGAATDGAATDGVAGDESDSLDAPKDAAMNGMSAIVSGLARAAASDGASLNQFEQQLEQIQNNLVGSAFDAGNATDDGSISTDDADDAKAEAAVAGKLATLAGELEQKEKLMATMLAGKSQLTTLYDTLALDNQSAALSTERDGLLAKLQEREKELQMQVKQMAGVSDGAKSGSMKKIQAQRDEYKARLKDLEGELKELRKKRSEAAKLRAMKERSDKNIVGLRQEIDSMKQQKCALQRKMREEDKQHRKDKKEQDHAMGQLKRHGQKQEFKLQKVQALHDKQQAVLRRKTEEVSAISKRMRDLQQKQKEAQKQKQQRQQRSKGPDGAEGMSSVKEWAESEVSLEVALSRGRTAMAAETSSRKQLAEQLPKLEAELEEHPADSAKAEELTREANQVRERMREHSKMISAFQQKLLVAGGGADDDDESGGSRGRKRWTDRLKNLPAGRRHCRALFSLLVSARCAEAIADQQADEAMVEATNAIEQLQSQQQEHEVALRTHQREMLEEMQQAEQTYLELEESELRKRTELCQEYEERAVFLMHQIPDAGGEAPGQVQLEERLRQQETQIEAFVETRQELMDALERNSVLEETVRQHKESRNCKDEAEEIVEEEEAVEEAADGVEELKELAREEEEEEEEGEEEEEWDESDFEEEEAEAEEEEEDDDDDSDWEEENEKEQRSRQSKGKAPKKKLTLTVDSYTAPVERSAELEEAVRRVKLNEQELAEKRKSGGGSETPVSTGVLDEIDNILDSDPTAPPKSLEDYKKLKVPELKTLLRARSLKLSGKKDELIERLMDADGATKPPDAPAADEGDENLSTPTGGDGDKANPQEKTKANDNDTTSTASVLTAGPQRIASKATTRQPVVQAAAPAVALAAASAAEVTAAAKPACKPRPPPQKAVIKPVVKAAGLSSGPARVMKPERPVTASSDAQPSKSAAPPTAPATASTSKSASTSTSSSSSSSGSSGVSSGPKRVLPVAGPKRVLSTAKTGTKNVAPARVVLGGRGGSENERPNSSARGYMAGTASSKPTNQTNSINRLAAPKRAVGSVAAAPPRNKTAGATMSSMSKSVAAASAMAKSLKPKPSSLTGNKPRPKTGGVLGDITNARQSNNAGHKKQPLKQRPLGMSSGPQRAGSENAQSQQQRRILQQQAASRLSSR